MHGAHHVAQKSTTVILPLISADLSVPPDTLTRSHSGAGAFGCEGPPFGRGDPRDPSQERSSDRPCHDLPNPENPVGLRFYTPVEVEWDDALRTGHQTT